RDFAVGSGEALLASKVRQASRWHPSSASSPCSASPPATASCSSLTFATSSTKRVSATSTRPFDVAHRSASSLASPRSSSGGSSEDRAHALRALEASIDLVPVHVREERIDVASDAGAEVHLITVLVHVHHEQRHARGEHL